MKYDKQPIDLSQQLALLKQRGLLVTDEEKALKQLDCRNTCTWKAG